MRSDLQQKHSPPAIHVTGARTHNLKAVSCSFPHRRLTVVTGVSGSGKSSLVFDTLFAESRRRFVESMSTYARQFLDQIERPPVDSIDNLLPAVAIEAKNSIDNARSTVGTCTEVYDLLRLVFAHFGTTHCPRGHGPVRTSTPQEVARACLAASDSTITVLAALPRPSRDANLKLKELIRQGFFRRWSDGTLERLTPGRRWLKAYDPLELALGRFSGATESSTRLVAAIEEAFQLTGGKVQCVDSDGNRHFFGRGLTCRHCGSTVPRPTPALFSFNSPLGACRTCRGFGRTMGLDRERVLPDPRKTLAERPFAPWNSPAYQRLYQKMWQFCRDQGIPLDLPFADLSEDQQELLFSGTGKFTSLEKWFAKLGRKSYRVHIRVLLARYRAYFPCPDCDGTRLRPEARAVRFAGASLAELSRLSLEELSKWVADLESPSASASPATSSAATKLLARLHRRLDTLVKVGLGYLSIDRQARTLSGGETQRIQLATALGSGLTSTLYALDEPTIGLHPKDSERLLDLLKELTLRGNTVVVVEHDPTLIRGADHVIDIGPRAGEHGGEVLCEGTLETLLDTETSLTATYLRKDQRRHRALARSRSHRDRLRREKPHRASPEDAVAARPRISILGASANNLDSIDVDFPLGSLVAVTGVSGSGKSTLVNDVLFQSAQRADQGLPVRDCEALVGREQISEMVLVEQRPLGRSSRSNPVTYVRAYDELRKLYAKAAAQRGHDTITPGHFSFNTDKGRCPECKGTGEVEIDMHFMAAVQTSCDSCQGRRFTPEILAIRFEGLPIDETLHLTVDSALDRFSAHRKLTRKLQLLADVGLGYIRLGQSTATLSRGEAQRLKLASFLDRPSKASELPRLYLFDEPTTGLHLADIDLLHHSLRRLLQAGESVLVIEHSTDLIARCDWVIDLGPGGGANGGRLLFSGPTADFLAACDSQTADQVRHHYGLPQQRVIRAI